MPRMAGLCVPGTVLFVAFWSEAGEGRLADAVFSFGPVTGMKILPAVDLGIYETSANVLWSWTVRGHCV